MLKNFTAQIMGLILEKAPFLVPLKRAAANETWLAFRHPRPAYPVHFLILPRKAWRNVFDCPCGDEGVMEALFHITSVLIKNQHLDQSSCRLVINGGAYQTAALMHAHLISGTGS